MPLQQSTLGSDVFYQDGQVYLIQLCSQKMTFSSCVQYLSCCGVEVLICILFRMVVNCHWELVIERHYFHYCGFWVLCKECEERAHLSFGSWWRGLLLEVMGQLAARPEAPRQGQQRGQLPSWRGLPNSNHGKGLQRIIHIKNGLLNKSVLQYKPK